jgi:hypothetical protein
MSKERGKRITSQEAVPTQQTTPTERLHPIQPASSSEDQPATPPKQQEQDEADKKPAARRDEQSESTTQSTPETPNKPRQVIAVSASKGPAAFFNLARKFLVTDEMCDLSALEGAIVSAVDAAHLLERSKLATIVR